MLRWVLLLTMLLCITLFGSCAGQGGRWAAPKPAALGAGLPPLAGLPAPRSALAVTNYSFIAADLVDTADAQMTGATLDLQAANVSWAVLGGSFPGKTATHVGVSGTCTNLYVMVSHYGSNRWKLVGGPLSAAGSLALPSGVMRADDSVFFALLCVGGNTSSISVSVQLSDGVPSADQPVSGAVRTEADFPLANATLTLSGTCDFQTTSAANGDYSFAAVPPGDYQLSAELADCAFAPASRSITVAAAPVSGQNFTASLDIDAVPYRFLLDYGAGETAVIRPAKGMNIDVYVEPGLGVAGWQADYDSAFKDAILNWNALSDPWGLFHIRNTSVEADAEIVVSWVPSLGGQTLGVANVSFLSNGTVELPWTIEMATGNVDGLTNANVVRMVAVHEVGHCLGLWDHSDQNTDIMYPFVGGFELPSRRDHWTVYTLFNTPADFSTNGRGPAQVGGLQRWSVSKE